MKLTKQALSKLTVIFVMFSLLPAMGFAKDKKETEYIELQQRLVKWHIEYYLNDDFTVEKTSFFEAKPLSKKMVKSLKKRRFSYSTSIEKFDVLEAYTLKVDGTRIDVPKDNYQVNVNKGSKDGGPVFSDRTRVTVIFPELELNDSIVMKTILIETEPMFPGHFSASQRFGSQTAYDDVKITINVPESLEFKHQVTEMKEKIKTKKGRKIIKLSYKNKTPIKNRRIDFSVWDVESEAGFSLSTFKTYEAIARAYGDRASPKAVPTDRVKKLARKIVKKEKDQREKARLLYDWVAMNISYAGNCIGVGAVVPHDIDFVLDNKMGDCKDHATLLQALYMAEGIESTQALINSRSIYKLPRIPLVTSVNHVLNYIQAFDQFVDATNDSMPFDLLAFSVSDKPVLLVDNYQKGLRTPATQVGRNRQEVDSVMKIQTDGSVVGSIDIKLKGRPAVSARRSWRHASTEQEEDWVEKMFSSQGKIGSGSMKKDDPNPLESEFNYSFEFNKPEYILSNGAGGFYIYPLVTTPAPVNSYIDHLNEDIEGYEVACGSGYSIERYVFEFPESMKILAKPNSFEINENNINFKATYELKDNKLFVVREISDETPGNICSPELMNAQRKTLVKISENVKSQVVYQY